MNTIALWQRFRWMYVPASLLTFLLQRSPVLRLLGTAEFSGASPAGALLRSAVTVAAASEREQRFWRLGRPVKLRGYDDRVQIASLIGGH